jgi:hypothetical protein
LSAVRSHEIFFIVPCLTFFADMGHGFCPVKLPFLLVPLSRSQFYPRFVPSAFRASCLILPHPPSHPVSLVIKAASIPIFFLIWVCLGLLPRACHYLHCSCSFLLLKNWSSPFPRCFSLPVSSKVELSRCRAMMEPAPCLLAVT